MSEKGALTRRRDTLDEGDVKGFLAGRRNWTLARWTFAGTGSASPCRTRSFKKSHSACWQGSLAQKVSHLSICSRHPATRRQEGSNSVSTKLAAPLTASTLSGVDMRSQAGNCTRRSGSETCFRSRWVPRSRGKAVGRNQLDLSSGKDPIEGERGFAPRPSLA